VFDLRQDRLLRFTPGEERVRDDGELIEAWAILGSTSCFRETQALRHDVDYFETRVAVPT